MSGDEARPLVGWKRLGSVVKGVPAEKLLNPRLVKCSEGGARLQNWDTVPPDITGLPGFKRDIN